MFADQQQKRNDIARPELQEDVSREDIVAAFRNAMVNHFRSHIPGTNINENTLLASDYLNHFHELVMLLEAVADDPDDFADDLAAWRPLTYEEHFTASGFRDKNLAIAAYRRAPHPIRQAFDGAVDRLHGEAVILINMVRSELQSEDRSSLRIRCTEGSGQLRLLIEAANAIAIGKADPGVADESSAAGSSQDEIDALFR